MSVDFVRTYFDTQVKYGEKYTYNIYAYVLTIGIKYKFTDLAITRQIGQYGVSDMAVDLGLSEPGDLNHCLEFYNPTTEKATPQLMDPDDLIKDNDFATSAQLYTEDQYLADFYLNSEPSAKIMEIPILSKAVST